MTELISQCGFCCSRCPAYMDNITSRQHQKQVHDVWKMYFNVNIPADEITCSGCHTGNRGDRVLPEKHCPVRTCVTRKMCSNCAHCQQYPCTILECRMQAIEGVIRQFRDRIPDEIYQKFIQPYDARPVLERLRKKG
ncbi:MAG: hypothetical protein STSR0009_08070 [Methanoregula sp.]